VVLLAPDGRITVTSTDAKKEGFYRYDAGGPVRSYLSGGVRFRPGPDPRTLQDEKGGSWHIREDALIGPAGERAPRVAGTLAYWFAWHGLYWQTTLER
jgi:hypothetical protein